MEKGLFRLWLVGSVVWVALLRWAVGTDVVAVFYVAPPLVAAALLAAGLWVAKGFAR